MYAIRSYYVGYQQDLLVHRITPNYRENRRPWSFPAIPRARESLVINNQIRLLYRRERQAQAVITSYSIHYTKLYDFFELRILNIRGCHTINNILNFKLTSQPLIEYFLFFDS